MEALVILALQVAGEILGTVVGNLPFVGGWHWRRARRTSAQWRDLGPTLASSQDTARRAAQRAAAAPYPSGGARGAFTHLWIGLAWLCGGVLIGAGVSHLWPHTFLPNAALRLANLVLAPIVAGILAEWLARRRNDFDPDVDPRQHFWRAFWFTLGLAGARLVGSVHA